MENHWEARLFILHLREGAFEGGSRLLRATLGFSGQWSRDLKAITYLSEVSPTQWQKGLCCIPKRQRGQTPAPSSRSCLADRTPMRFCRGGFWASMLVQRPQRRVNSLGTGRSFSKNNNVLLTNIWSISTLLNVQQTLGHSANICSLGTVWGT